MQPSNILRIKLLIYMDSWLRNIATLYIYICAAEAQTFEAGKIAQGCYTGVIVMSINLFPGVGPYYRGETGG